MPKLTSENRLIQLLQHRYPAKSALLKKGIGDDAAVVRPRNADEYWLITSDMLLEGVDFRTEWTTPRRLGYKSISVNLSDLAAMGARPRFFTVSLAFPTGISERWVLEFYDGLTQPAGSKGAKLIGGDLSRSKNGILISITAVCDRHFGPIGRRTKAASDRQRKCPVPSATGSDSSPPNAGASLRSGGMAGSVRHGPLYDGSERRSFNGSSPHVCGERRRRRN
jgi:thiamine monophosphate kinase